MRATAGVEAVIDGAYCRTIDSDGVPGSLTVRRLDTNALLLEVHVPDPRVLLAIVERVRGVFDLAADPMKIARRPGGKRWCRGDTA